jgi:hypothetical protein
VLRFISRLAFICNVFFVLVVVVQLTDWIQQQDATATIAIMGYFLALLVNPLVNLLVGIMFLFKRGVTTTVPRWLLWTNFAFFILQLVYIIYLNDTKHY